MHMNLCIALMQKQAWDEAIAAAREAIRCKPDLPEAHCNLGRALQQKGQLREALEALQRGHELGSKDPNWRYPSAQWVEECQSCSRSQKPNRPRQTCRRRGESRGAQNSKSTPHPSRERRGETAVT